MAILFLRGDLRQLTGPIYLTTFGLMTLLTPPLVLFEFDRGADLRFEALVSLLWLAPLILPILLERRLAEHGEQVITLLSRQPSNLRLGLARWVSLNASVLLLLTPLAVLCLGILPDRERLSPLWSGWDTGEIASLWLAQVTLACSLTSAISGLSATATPSLVAAAIIASYLRPDPATSLPWALLPDFPRCSPLLLGEAGVHLSSENLPWLLANLAAWSLLSIALRGFSWRRTDER